MAQNYNPYREESSNNNLLGTNNNYYNNRLARLAKFGRNYNVEAIKNAKGIHAYEDVNSFSDSSGNKYSMFSRKVNAMMQERQSVAALNNNYQMQLQIFKEYATKVEIRNFVSKMANEIVIYSKDKKFCDLIDLPDTYEQTFKTKVLKIFDDVYNAFGFNDGAKAWDICRDWLVEGYICYEIIYDNRGKNIQMFQKLAPDSIVPMVDPETGIMLWVQNTYGNTDEQRVLLDSEVIYISYSGSSNYMETSYIEPLIRPYNELKSIERSRLLFNLINATMHKSFNIPVDGLSPDDAYDEVQSTIADYKDNIAFDDTTGLMYIDGSKNLPYSKEYWFPTSEGQKAEMEIVDPAGHDLNESSMLIWFKNAMKLASKFPLSRLDAQSGGGSVYSFGGDISHDDYNFDQYVHRLRTIFKQILLKPIILQILIEFPEYEKNNLLQNDIDIKYYGISEIIKAKELSNMQARANIASDLMQLQRSEDKPLYHWKYIQKHVLEMTEEAIAENEQYFQDEEDGGSGGDGSGGNDEFGDDSAGFDDTISDDTISDDTEFDDAEDPVEDTE